MGAKIGSFLATLMLSVPLAAVGLMAIFGVPQFVPAVGTNEGQDFWSDSQNLFAGWSQGQQNGQMPPSQQSPDAFGKQQFDDAPRFASASNGQASTEFGSPSQPGQGENWNYERFNGPGGSTTPPSAQQQPQPQRPANPRTGFASDTNWPADSTPRQSSMTDARNTRETAGSAQWAESWSNPPMDSRVSTAAFEQRVPANPTTSPAASLTWRQASQRFSEWGVDNYHLERGATEGTFLFVCMYSPSHAPHVTHRFEAEADEPLLAVNQVIGQIDRWMQQRFANSNFPTRGQSLSLTSDPFLQ